MAEAGRGAWSGIARTLLRSSAGIVTAIAVVALTVAAAAGCLAGARRTATAFDRFVAWSDPPDLSLGGVVEAGGLDAVRAALASSPSVERFEEVFTLQARLTTPDGTVLPFDEAAVLTLSDPTMAGRLKVLGGTMPPPTAVDRVVVTSLAAERLGLRPGDRLTLSTPEGEFSMTVAAVVTAPSEFPTIGGRPLSFLAVMPAFLAAHPTLASEDDTSISIWLRGGAEAIDEFRAEGERFDLSDLDLDTQQEITTGVNRILQTDAFALALAGLLAAAVGAVVLLLVMRRVGESVAPDLRTLTTLGVTRAGRIAGGCAVGTLVGAAGALVGASASVVSSWLTPIGLARIAEPHPGFAADVAVLALAAVMAIVVGSLIGAWCALRAGRSPLAAARQARVAIVPEPAATGIRFALAPEGGGPRGKARPGLVGLATVVTLVVAVAVVGGSLSRVRDRPELSGGWWDGFVGTWAEGGAEALRGALAASPEVAGTARAGWLGDYEVEGTPLPLMFVDPEGDVEPLMTRGRAPSGPHEVALGAVALEATGRELGDDVTIELVGEDGTRTDIVVQVVGETVLAAPAWFTIAPGEGALVTTSFVERWSPDDLQGEPTLLRVVPGAEVQSVLARLRDAIPGEPDAVIAFARSPRNDVEALAGITTVPIALAIVLALLAAVTFVHLVIVGGRRYRRDQAILRSLGFTPRQARHASIVHCGALAAMALGIGVPLGLLLASLAWRVISTELVVTPRLFPPGGALVTGTLVAVALAMAMGATLGSRRWRARPAALLRTE